MPERCLFVAKETVVGWDAFSKPGKDVVNDRRFLSSQSELCLPSGRSLGECKAIAPPLSMTSMAFVGPQKRARMYDSYCRLSDAPPILQSSQRPKKSNMTDEGV